MGASNSELNRLLSETQGVANVSQIVKIYEEKLAQKDRILKICCDQINTLRKEYEHSIKTTRDNAAYSKNIFIGCANNYQKYEDGYASSLKDVEENKQQFNDILKKEGLQMEYEMIANTTK
jgi:hypothetical protein